MKYLKYNIWFVILLVFSFNHAFSQKKIKQELPKVRITGVGKPYNDHISLRWNVADAGIFSNLYKGGVLIDRLILDANDKAEGGWQRITKDTVRAWPLSTFNKPEYKEDTARLIIAQAMYGRSNYPEGLNLFQMAEIQEQERQNKHLIISLYSAISPSGAQSAGLAFDDAIKVDSAKKYVYRIYPGKHLPGLAILDTGYVFVLGHDIYANETFKGLKTENHDGYIFLKWAQDDSPFIGYWIERSSDKKIFTRVNKNIYLPPVDTTDEETMFGFMDSIPTYYKPYYYRLTGVNAFGEHIMYADTVSAMSVDRTPPKVVQLDFKRSDSKVTFSWKACKDVDLKGYYMLQGDDNMAADTLAIADMISPKATSASLILPKGFQSAYYRLMLLDTASNVSYSNSVYVFVSDTIAPDAPQLVSATIDSTGWITLNWRPDTKEKKMQGYKVFMANRIDHAFSAISEVIPDTTFMYKTTLQTLSRQLYFKVVAIDGNYNHSKMSKAIAVTRPDTIPPPRPVITDYTNDKGKITIQWAKDESVDLKEFTVFRRYADDKDWTSLAHTRNTEYVDVNFKQGGTYEYTLQSVDSSGNFSPYAIPVHLKTSPATKDSDIKFSGTYDKDSKIVSLRWNKPADEVQFYILYKNKGQGLTMYKSIPATQQEYTDQNGLPPSEYGIKIVYADDTESDIIAVNKK